MPTKNTDLLLIAQTKIAVCSIGEKNSWWQSSLFSDSSDQFYQHILPKSKFQAIIVTAFNVAKVKHDESVGPGKYHIFRLPNTLEERIHNYLESNAEELYKSIKGNELRLLEEMGNYLAIEEKPGPIMVGNANDLNDLSIFQVFAQHYFKAFANNYKSFPYLMA